MKSLQLRLYIAGKSAISRHAVRNLRQICDAHFTQDYILDIIDVVEHPEEIERERIIATPTLLKLQPPPLRRLIGDFSDSLKVLQALDVPE